MSFIGNIKKSIGLGGKERKPIPSSNFENEPLDDKGYIEPEQPFYEIILIKPLSMDDMDYVRDQIIEEKNPVIVDLCYIKEEGRDAIQMAGKKIKNLEQEYEADAISLCNDPNKNMVLITPSRILIKKE